MQDTILLRAEYDEGDAKTRVIALRKEMKELKTEFAGLTAQLQAGKLSSTEFAKKQAELQGAIEKTKKEIADNTKVVRQQDQAYKGAEAGLSKLKASTADLARQATILTSNQRGGAKATNEQRDAVASLASGFKKLEADTQGSLQGAEKVANQFEFSIEGIKGRLQGVMGALEGAKLGLTGLKGAIAATGIGVLLLALGALIAFLTRSQAGMDLLSRKMAGITGVFNFLADRVSDLGGVLVDIWEKPGEAVKKFGDFIEQNLINRFKAFGVILEAIKSGSLKGIADGFIQLGTGITNASDKAGALAAQLNKVRLANEAIEKENQAIRDSERGINLQRAKNEAQIEDLKKLSDDTTKSEVVRIEAARKANALEQTTLKQSLALQQRRIENIKAEMKLNNIKAADSDKLNEAEIEFEKLKQESATKQTELQNKLNGLRKEAADKAIEQAKNVLEVQIGNEQLRLRAAIATGRQTLLIEEDLILKKAALDKKGEKDKSKRELIDAQAAADITDIRIAKALEEQEQFFRIEESGINARLVLVKKGTQEEADLIKESIALNAQRDRLAAVSTIKDAKKVAAQLAAIDASEKAQKLAVDANLKAQLAQNDVTAIQARLNAVREGSSEEFKLRMELLEAQQKAELENVTLTQEQISEIKSRYAKAQKQVDTERLVQQANEEVVVAQTKLNKAKEGSLAAYKAEKEVIEKTRDAKIKAAKEEKKATDLIESEAAKALLDLDKKRFNDTVSALNDSANAATATLSNLFELQGALATKAFDKQEQAALKSAGTNAELRAGIEEEFQNKRNELEKEGAKKRKAIARTEALINTAVGITKATQVLPPFGAILATFIGLEGLAQQALISAQEFADGGAFYELYRNGPLVKGPGGPKEDKVNAKLSNGESVLTAKATAQRYQELSEINEEGGGRRFPGAKPYGTLIKPAPRTEAPYMPALRNLNSYFGYGGFASGGVMAGNGGTQSLDVKQLSREIGREVGANVDAALRANPQSVSVTEIETKRSNVIAREARASYRPQGS